MYDRAELINSINSVTNSKLFVVGHSQGTIISLVSFTQPEIVEKVEAAALLSPISYLNHVSAPMVQRMVNMHIDQMIVTAGVRELNFKSEWGANLLVSLCDTCLSYSDMLSSITGKNCCFNESRVAYYIKQEPHNHHNEEPVFCDRPIQHPAAYLSYRQHLQRPTKANPVAQMKHWPNTHMQHHCKLLLDMAY